MEERVGWGDDAVRSSEAQACEVQPLVSACCLPASERSHAPWEAALFAGQRIRKVAFQQVEIKQALVVGPGSGGGVAAHQLDCQAAHVVAALLRLHLAALYGQFLRC